MGKQIDKRQPEDDQKLERLREWRRIAVAVSTWLAPLVGALAAWLKPPSH